MRTGMPAKSAPAASSDTTPAWPSRWAPMLDALSRRPWKTKSGGSVSSSPQGWKRSGPIGLARHAPSGPDAGRCHRRPSARHSLGSGVAVRELLDRGPRTAPPTARTPTGSSRRRATTSTGVRRVLNFVESRCPGSPRRRRWGSSRPPGPDLPARRPAWRPSLCPRAAASGASSRARGRACRQESSGQRACSPPRRLPPSASAGHSRSGRRPRDPTGPWASSSITLGGTLKRPLADLVEQSAKYSSGTAPRRARRRSGRAGGSVRPTA